MTAVPPPSQLPSGYPPPGGRPPGATTVPNYLVFAILTTLLCCLPAGVVAIVYAAQVNGKEASGDYAGAVDSSNKAKLWCIISAVVGLLAIIAGFAMGVIGGLAEAQSGNF